MRPELGKLLRTACLFSMAFAASPALAQTAGAPEQGSDASTGVEEIIVTAQRREESAQRAPITIEVLSADMLDRAGITDVAGLQRLATGVEVGQGGANAQIFIRGVGGASFSPLSTPGVAFNVDGVYVGRPDGVNGNFYDIARVEVLKGPQGTLYGRNANGGSINVITNAPELGVSAFDLDVEAGNYDLRHTSGSINLPIGDNAAVRAAFNMVDRDGYLSSGANDDVQQSGRLRFRVEPSADVAINLTADYTHLGGRGGDYTYLPQRPGSDPYESTTSAAANIYMHGFGLGFLVDDLVNDNHQDTELFNLTGQLDWDLGFAQLTVLPAYRYLDSNYITHFGSSYTSSSQTDQSSLEVRLANSTDSLNWVVGGYLYREATDGIVHVYASNLLQNIIIDYSPLTEAYAVFGQATYSVTPDVRLIAGIRYTHEDSSHSGSIYDVPLATVTEPFGGADSFNGTTYRLGAEYDLSPSSLLYLTYSTGFKAGGFSQTIEPVAPTDPDNTFEPELLTSIEFGSKNRFFDNRLQINFGMFHWSYDDLQDQRVSFDALGNINFLTFNSGDATLYGGNVDIAARPTSADTINVSVEYAHSEYDTYTFQTPTALFNPTTTGCPYVISGPVVTGDCSGFQMARVPEWTGSLGYAHDFNFGDNTLTFDANVKYSSARWLAIDFTDAERDSGYTTVDANLTYRPANERWSIGLFGRNLTEAVYYTGGIQTAFGGELFAANIAPPRVYGLRASLRLGD